jgi:transcriptional regulator GlxA family with amidase domain
MCTPLRLLIGLAHLSEPLDTTELCERIAVTEPTLRSCCAEFLGMSPTRYVLLRRLSRARVVLRDAVPGGANLLEFVRGPRRIG